MRLLHTRNFTFKECYDLEIPRYAILSHRWRDEITYQDFLAGRRLDSTGYQKILKECELVAADNGSYSSWIWIDTICINKESSTELYEAINSMWRWYHNADICYVYLDDVSDRRRTEPGHHDLLSFTAQFCESEWFDRGWTLQEVLAPSNVEFLSQTWIKLGDKP